MKVSPTRRTVAALSLLAAVVQRALGDPVSLGSNYDTWLSKILRYDIPAQHKALKLMRDAGISRVKIFTSNRDLIAGVSEAWGSSPLQMMIAVENGELAELAQGQPSFKPERLDELMDTIAAFPTRVEFIAVGNEVEYPAINYYRYAPHLLPVLHAIHSALQRRGLGHVRLTCPFSDIMIINPGNPSEATFKDSYDSALSCNEKWCKNSTPIQMSKYVLPALNFLNRTGGAFTTSVYPFYKWRNLGNPDWCTRPGYGPCIDQTLSFAVGAPGAPKYLDTKSGLLYSSSLAVMLDTVRFALASRGFGNLQFIVGETGWPSAGISGTSSAASCWYTNSLMALMKHGSPASDRFGDRLPIIYQFQWVDELGKYDFLGQPEDPGPIEDHFGLLDSWLKPKFPFNLAEGRADCPALPMPSFQLSRVFQAYLDWPSVLAQFCVPLCFMLLAMFGAAWLNSRACRRLSKNDLARQEPLLGYLA